jgi:hypothetical protein
MSLMQRGAWGEALALCDRLLAKLPEMHEARLNRALALLATGQFEQGWKDYEARKRAHCHFMPRWFPWPEWRGEPLAGKSIYIYGEQGLGDEIMFASCFQDVIGRARQCVIECSPRLLTLFGNSFERAHVVCCPPGPERALGCGHPTVDLQIAAGSLPGIFRSAPESFPRSAGYLKADPSRVQYWRSRLDALGPGPKVGVSWRGGAAATRRAARTIALDSFVPMLRLRDHRFLSLQYGDAVQECIAVSENLGFDAVAHWPEAIDDFAELAALLCALDLIVSVCTAVVHLAGALGRPTWVLVPSAPEWRYLVQGTTMPWYPSVKLYRQPADSGWEPVVARIADDLGARRYVVS